MRYTYYVTAQVVRSADGKSVHGLGKESSIQNAYLKLIDNAKHFIYIEVFRKNCFKRN